MSISSVFLNIEDVVEVEVEWMDDKVVVWYWHGENRKIGHVRLEGQPEIFIKHGEGRRGIEDVIEAHVEQPETYVPKTGSETRARVIELLSNTREGYTVEQLVTFVPNITRKSSMHTVLYDLRKSGIDVRKGPSRFGGTARAFWIEAS